MHLNSANFITNRYISDIIVPTVCYVANMILQQFVPDYKMALLHISFSERETWLLDGPLRWRVYVPTTTRLPLNKQCCSKSFFIIVTDHHPLIGRQLFDMKGFAGDVVIEAARWQNIQTHILFRYIIIDSKIIYVKFQTVRNRSREITCVSHDDTGDAFLSINYGFVKALSPRDNGHRFSDHIFECIFLKQNVRSLLKISVLFNKTSL